LETGKLVLYLQVPLPNPLPQKRRTLEVIRKEEKPQVNDLGIHFSKLEKEEKLYPKHKEEIIKRRNQ
jgi:hypothetical protein